FYGLSFLETFHAMGRRKWYMIFSLTDETYSLLCSVKTPEGIDAGDMRFWIAILDHSYWILGSVLGTIIGGILPFDTTGIDFAMTSLFTVIFVEQWQSTKCHIPALMGLAAAAVSLAILGPDNFILPAMLAICVMLVAMRGRLAKEVA
ncbi:MAG: AzlC family ABC transporter permease, partial [Butyricicoccus sp.]